MERPTRTLVIGNIHGALFALMQVLSRSNFDEKEDLLIFLGDYTDKGKFSAQVIQYLISLSNTCTFKPIFLRGEHDTWCQNWLEKQEDPIPWGVNGGDSTIKDYLQTGYIMSEDHKDFFNSLSDYYIDNANRGFVHGGYASLFGLGNETDKTIYQWDRELWDLAIISDNNIHFNKYNVPINNHIYKHKEIFIAHIPTLCCVDKDKIPVTTPLNKCNVWNMHTGIEYDIGRLSIMDVTTKEVWQSDTRKEINKSHKICCTN